MKERQREREKCREGAVGRQLSVRETILEHFSEALKAFLKRPTTTCITLLCMCVVLHSFCSHFIQLEADKLPEQWITLNAHVLMLLQNRKSIFYVASTRYVFKIGQLMLGWMIQTQMFGWSSFFFFCLLRLFNIHQLHFIYHGCMMYKWQVLNKIDLCLFVQAQAFQFVFP